MSKLLAQWRFLPSPVAALYQGSYLIRRGLFKAIAPIAATTTGDILDFGCGSKPYRPLFTSCKSYTGLDIDVSGHDHSDSLVDVFYDGKVIPFEDESFDAVVAFEVFEHVFNIDEIFAQLQKKLRPGGRLLITVPFAWPEHEQPYDFARYTSFGIADIIARSGLSIVEVKKTNGAFVAINQLFLNYLISNIFDRLGIVGKFAKIPFCFLINMFALLGNLLLPTDTTYYSNLVVLAEKRPAT